MNISYYNFPDFLLIFFGIAIFSLFIYAGIISLMEKEKKAAINFFLIGIIVPLPFLITGFFDFNYHALISIILLSLIFILLMIYFIPIHFTAKILDVFPKVRIDERDTMFSRNKLQKDSKNYKEYYKNNPDKLKFDEELKNNPGLLAEESSNYDPFMFSSANASFYTVDALKLKVDGIISSKKINSNPEDISIYIKNWTKKLGALNVGITEFKDYHKYSYLGRDKNYGNKVILNHKFAIVFTVEMDFPVVKCAPSAPTVMESAQQYLAAGAIAVQLAEFIRQLGFPARAHIDGNYELVCPLVAKDAGLGEIGRMGLLITPKHGPRVRIAVVTTDIPLISDKRTFDPTVINFCNICKKCATNCPTNAISHDDRKIISGTERWQINQESCFHFWTKCGTDCGRCLSVCPYSHPNNFLHNIIRFGIKNSGIFSSIALFFDDIFYGKKPKTKTPATWIKV
ncbi:MAG: 4Fe-4S dicluster domain-containing protein, partial [Bacteroidales bacterium]|nr:4Fe-4S dicluster domain-containing protein [Bacteroidales bacterium]